MTKQWWFAVIPFLLLSVIPSSAQCGMYAYHDLWLDESGEAIGENYTQAVCAGGSAFADVYVRMPSGYQVGASASGSPSAEAVTQSSAWEGLDDGRFWGFNETFGACFDDGISTFFDQFFLLAFTRLHWLGTRSNCWAFPDPEPANCDYDVESWCTPETTPPSFNPSQVTDAMNPLPLGYWDATALCVRILTGPWHCPNLLAPALQTTGPGGIMPRAVCTKRD